MVGDILYESLAAFGSVREYLLESVDEIIPAEYCNPIGHRDSLL